VGKFHPNKHPGGETVASLRECVAQSLPAPAMFSKDQSDQRGVHTMGKVKTFEGCHADEPFQRPSLISYTHLTVNFSTGMTYLSVLSGS
jgi:hypothetical protein